MLCTSWYITSSGSRPRVESDDMLIYTYYLRFRNDLCRVSIHSSISFYFMTTFYILYSRWLHKNFFSSSCAARGVTWSTGSGNPNADKSDLNRPVIVAYIDHSHSGFTPFAFEHGLSKYSNLLYLIWAPWFEAVFVKLLLTYCCEIKYSMKNSCSDVVFYCLISETIVFFDFERAVLSICQKEGILVCRQGSLCRVLSVCCTRTPTRPAHEFVRWLNNCYVDRRTTVQLVQHQNGAKFCLWLV